MPSSPTWAVTRQGRLLKAIIKGIRQERRMTVAEVAARMAISPRSYDDFEAGRGKLDLAKVRLFARATESDAVAITLALLFETKEIAFRAAPNKAATVLFYALRELENEVGDQLSLVPSNNFLEAVRGAFDRIKDFLRKRDAGAERWLELEIQKLYTPDPEDPGEGET